MVTNAWLVYALVVSLLSALIGGYVCQLVGQCSRTVVLFAFIVLVFGVGQAFANTKKPVVSLSHDQVAAMSAMDRAGLARQPNWFAWILPMMAFSGILMGGRLRGS